MCECPIGRSGLAFNISLSTLCDKWYLQLGLLTTSRYSFESLTIDTSIILVLIRVGLPQNRSLNWYHAGLIINSIMFTVTATIALWIFACGLVNRTIEQSLYNVNVTSSPDIRVWVRLECADGSLQIVSLHDFVWPTRVTETESDLNGLRGAG